MEPKLNAKSIHALRTTLGLDKKAFGARLGVTRQTVLTWEEGKHEPKGASRVVLLQLLTQTKGVKK